MNNLCIKCKEGPVAGNAINHVGAHHKEGMGKKHPIDTIIDHATTLSLEDLVSTLKHNKTNNIATFIHINCRNYLKNNSRPKRSASSEDVQRKKKICTRTEDNLFNFKQQCFYCEKNVQLIRSIQIEIHLKK